MKKRFYFEIIENDKTKTTVSTAANTMQEAEAIIKKRYAERLKEGCSIAFVNFA